VPDEPAAFDLSSTFVHLGAGPTAVPVPDFRWTPDFLGAYHRAFEADGDAGRLVSLLDQERSWPAWERHPAGEELVVAVSGRYELIVELGIERHRLALEPGWAYVNPRGAWHTLDVLEPGRALFVTPGRGTEVRPR